jgi:glycolate oxidase iron-sulfur subunit
VVIAPDQGCCGALAIHAGDFEAGRRMARRNIDAFENSEYVAVLSNAAGCGASMKEYDYLLRDDPAYAERASQFVLKMKDVTEFLANEGLQVQPGELDVTVTYQEPCHLVHAQKISNAAA